MKMRVKINEETYEVEVGDLSSRPIVATVEGESFEIWPEELDLPAAAAASAPSAPAPAAPRPAAPPPVAAPAPAAAGSGSVIAPLPGVINSIKVKVGDTVSAGQEVLVLEAMKMNNAIRASRAGTVKAIYVSQGDRVNHNQPLLDIG